MRNKYERRMEGGKTLETDKGKEEMTIQKKLFPLNFNGNFILVNK
jgi:hypothetical protein